MQKYETPTELSARWGVSARTVREWAQRGEIPAVRFGKLWRFPSDQIVKFERAQGRMGTA